MKKILSNKVITILLICFMIIQPFLDVSFLFENDQLFIFGITIPTIVRTLFITAIGIITFLKSKNKREGIGIIIYFIILIIYSLLHHFVCSSDMNIPDTFKYSMLNEMFYMFRMLLPLIIIYVTKNVKLKYDNYIDVILYSSMIIGIVIIMSNTFLVLYTSYDSNALTIKASWIDWIFGDISKYKFEELTSKGWFYMANQVSGLMLLLLPQCIMDVFKKAKASNIIATIMLTFAMIILGTRTSAYGWLLVYTSIILSVLMLYKLRHIKKINFNSLKISLLIFTIFSLVLLISPIRLRESNKKIKPEVIPPQLTQNEDVYKYIEKYYSYYGIPDAYIKDLYPYQYDYKFWLDTFDKSNDHILNYRELESLISNKIENNNSKLKYKLFGLSYSRMRNGKVYVEKDFYAQYITIGIIGIIVLLIPYFICILKLTFKNLKENNLNIEFASFIISVLALFGSSIFTGHILDELFVMLYTGFIIGYYLSVGGKNEKS